MDVLVAKVLLSFVVGGFWITLAILLAERLGSKVGGILIALPSTTLVSMFFIGSLEGTAYAAQTAALEPFGLIAAGVLIFLSVALLKKYNNKAFLAAFAAWFMVAVSIKSLGFHNMVAGAIIYSVMCILLYFYLEKILKVPSLKVGAKKYALRDLLLKACIAGSAVATTVVVADLAGPFWGGVFATLPAATISAMYMLNKEHGPVFAMATGKAVLIGSLVMVAFVIAVNLSYPFYGLVWGTAISYAISGVAAVIIYLLMGRK